MHSLSSVRSINNGSCVSSIVDPVSLGFLKNASFFSFSISE